MNKLMKQIPIFLAILGGNAAAAPTTMPDDAAPTVVQVYDVRELTYPTTNYPLLPSMLPTIPGDNNLANDPVTNNEVDHGKIDSLTHLIEESIAQETWTDNGGISGKMAQFDGHLVISQTAAAQNKIRDLLGALAADADRSVRVDATWVSFTPEQLNGLLNPNGGAVALIDPKFFAGLKTYCRGQTLGLNGQTVHVTCEQEQQYVSNATPVVAPGAVAYSPTFSTVRSGVALQVTPTITGAQALVDLRSVVGIVSDLGTAPVVLSSSTEPATMPSGDALIQRPKIESQQFHTTVRVPLGEYAIIGGMSRAPGDPATPDSQLYLVIRVDVAK